jgi:hypothetical protein
VRPSLDIDAKAGEIGLMPDERGNDRRPLPNKATRLQGVRDRFFGRREYAHPQLRWASGTLFRVAWLLFAINFLSDQRSTILLVITLTLGAISLAADAINAMLLRRRSTR